MKIKGKGEGREKETFPCRVVGGSSGSGPPQNRLGRGAPARSPLTHAGATQGPKVHTPWGTHLVSPLMSRVAHSCCARQTHSNHSRPLQLHHPPELVTHPSSITHANVCLLPERGGHSHLAGSQALRRPGRVDSWHRADFPVVKALGE